MVEDPFDGLEKLVTNSLLARLGMREFGLFRRGDSGVDPSTITRAVQLISDGFGEALAYEWPQLWSKLSTLDGKIVLEDGYIIRPIPEPEPRVLDLDGLITRQSAPIIYVTKKTDGLVHFEIFGQPVPPITETDILNRVKMVHPNNIAYANRSTGSIPKVDPYKIGLDRALLEHLADFEAKYWVYRSNPEQITTMKEANLDHVLIPAILDTLLPLTFIRLYRAVPDGNKTELRANPLVVPIPILKVKTDNRELREYLRAGHQVIHVDGDRERVYEHILDGRIFDIIRRHPHQSLIIKFPEQRFRDLEYCMMSIPFVGNRSVDEGKYFQILVPAQERGEYEEQVRIGGGTIRQREPITTPIKPVGGHQFAASQREITMDIDPDEEEIEEQLAREFESMSTMPLINDSHSGGITMNTNNKDTKVEAIAVDATPIDRTTHNDAGSGPKTPPPIPQEASGPGTAETPIVEAPVRKTSSPTAPPETVMRMKTGPIPPPPTPTAEQREIYWFNKGGVEYVVNSPALIPVVTRGQRVRSQLVDPQHVPVGAIYHEGHRSPLEAVDSYIFHQMRNGTPVRISNDNLAQYVAEDTIGLEERTQAIVAAERMRTKGWRRIAGLALGGAAFIGVAALANTYFQAQELDAHVTTLQKSWNGVRQAGQSIPISIDAMKRTLGTSEQDLNARHQAVLGQEGEVRAQVRATKQEYATLEQQIKDLRQSVTSASGEIDQLRAGPYTQLQQGVSEVFSYLNFASHLLPISLGQVTPAQVIARSKGEPILTLGGDVEQYMTQRCKDQSPACEQQDEKLFYWVDGTKDCEFALGQVFLRASGLEGSRNDFVAANNGKYCSGDHVDKVGNTTSVWFEVKQ